MSRGKIRTKRHIDTLHGLRVVFRDRMGFVSRDFVIQRVRPGFTRGAPVFQHVLIEYCGDNHPVVLPFGIARDLMMGFSTEGCAGILWDQLKNACIEHLGGAKEI